MDEEEEKARSEVIRALRMKFAPQEDSLKDALMRELGMDASGAIKDAAPYLAPALGALRGKFKYRQNLGRGFTGELEHNKNEDRLGLQWGTDF